jgi:phospholipid/cholesterol/gamma-HCH transport system permease protein
MLAAVRTPSTAANASAAATLVAWPRALVAAVGARTIAWASWARSVAALCGHALWRLGPGIAGMRRVTRSVLVRQVLFTGVEALPFTGLIAALVGSTVILQAQRNVSAAASAAVLAKLLVVVIARELGPLVAGLIVIGRSGTAMTVELGNMRVDPVEYLVVPRVCGMAVSLVALALFFVFVSMSVGVIASGLISGSFAAPLEFAAMLASSASLVDVAALIAKTVLPGTVIAAIACFEGLTAGPEMTDVPRAATRGTVRAMTATFVTNAAISALVYLA